MTLSSFHRRIKFHAGVTLVELLVVLVILAIAAAVVVPRMVAAGDFQAMSAARILVADLQYAQDSAVTTQQEIIVEFSEDGLSYTLSNESGPLIHPMSKTGYTMNFAAMRGYGSVRLDADFGTGGRTVSYDVTGSPSTGGTVLVKAGSRQYVVTVAAATGQVTVED